MRNIFHPRRYKPSNEIEPGSTIVWGDIICEYIDSLRSRSNHVIIADANDTLYIVKRQDIKHYKSDVS